MTTSTQTQLRRGTNTQVNSMTPALGEAVVDTTNTRLNIGDGSTAGGLAQASANDIQTQSFTYPAVSGTANAIVLTNTPARKALTAGQKGTFKAGSNNTSAVTINEDGFGVKNLYKMNNGALVALVANDLISGGLYDYLYDGTQYQVKGLAEGPFSAGALKYLGTVTASNSATVNLMSLLSSTYDDYRIILTNVVAASNGVSLQMQCSPDNSTFDTAANYSYAFTSLDSGGATSNSSSNSATGILIANNVDNGSGLSAAVNLFGVNTSSMNRYTTAETSNGKSTGNFARGSAAGVWLNNSNALEAVRFFMASGNVFSGTFKVYGIAKA